MVLCVRERVVLVENLRCWLFSAARWNAVHVFFHAVVDFLYFSLLSVCCGRLNASEAARSIVSSHFSDLMSVSVL